MSIKSTPVQAHQVFGASAALVPAWAFLQSCQQQFVCSIIA